MSKGVIDGRNGDKDSFNAKYTKWMQNSFKNNPKMGNVVNNVHVDMNKKNVVECFIKDCYDTSGYQSCIQTTSK